MATAVVNGAELFWEELGTGTPLLLMHGTGAYSGLWTPVLDGLSRRYRVISYDRRGFGRSSPGSRCRFADHAKDAAGLLDALDAGPAVVVGWSGGGVVALDLAASSPRHVRELVLVEPAVRMLLHVTRTSLTMTARSSFSRYVRRDRAAAAQAMYRWAGGYSTGGNAFDGFPLEWQQQMRGHADATLREMDQLLRPRPSRAAVRSIACPVTLIEGGLSDPAFAKADAWLRRLLPQARTVVVTGAAHMTHTDRPEAWVEAVVALEPDLTTRSRPPDQQ